MSEFKVGNRVIFEGKIGTIVRDKTESLSGESYGVEFDDYNSEFHDLGGLCKNGYGWCCPISFLQLLEQSIYYATKIELARPTIKADLIRFGCIKIDKKKEGNEMNLINKIDRYIVNNKAVIIFWKDGNKTIAKVDEKDEFDKEIGFMIAFNKGLNFYHSNRKISKTELKKIYECISNDKFKQYLFLLFNRFTFQDTIKSKKYLEGLEVKK